MIIKKRYNKEIYLQYNNGSFDIYKEVFFGDEIIDTLNENLDNGYYHFDKSLIEAINKFKKEVSKQLKKAV